MRRLNHEMKLLCCFVVICALTGMFGREGYAQEKAPLRDEAAKNFFEDATPLAETQSIVGTWQGMLKIEPSDLVVIFHIARCNGDYCGTMDSPGQGARGIPVSTVQFDGVHAVFHVSVVGGIFSGDLNSSENRLEGTWEQSGVCFPLILTKQRIKKRKPNQATQ